MKLRIKGNSIRLRLLRSEVEEFAEGGSISDETRFGANALRYTLAMSNNSQPVVFGNGALPETENTTGVCHGYAFGK